VTRRREAALTHWNWRWNHFRPRKRHVNGMRRNRRGGIYKTRGISGTIVIVIWVVHVIPVPWLWRLHCYAYRRCWSEANTWRTEFLQPSPSSKQKDYVLWDVAPCSLVDRQRRFGETSSFHKLYQSTLLHIPEDSKFHFHFRENHKPHITMYTLA
jgi:hypothetical protein